MAYSMLTIIATLCILHVSNAVYYLAEPDKWRCFKDTVVNNYVSLVWVNTRVSFRRWRWKYRS